MTLRRKTRKDRTIRLIRIETEEHQVYWRWTVWDERHGLPLRTGQEPSQTEALQAARKATGFASLEVIIPEDAVHLVADDVLEAWKKTKR